MVKNVVIRAEAVGKKYIIGHEARREGYAALRDVLARTVKDTWRKTLDMASGRTVISGDTIEEFWALKDVSFEVERGEVLGIIGRNGAGKSTLLKILSRITEPSEGRIVINGRVSSLLEVGTGFHPELTGRENIYLNGAILGMTRAEVKRKFDDIVAFAEVERFLDTPVKRYSSGMYVRLAFAVAAHLEPEILIVDEVLAVGDAEFQQKCLGKMSDVATGGRTVLFVSHNAGAIESLCDSCMLLDGGKVDLSSRDVRSVLAHYSSKGSESTRRNIQFPVTTSHFNLVSFSLRRRDAVKSENFFSKADEIIIDIKIDIHDPSPMLNFGYALYGSDDRCLWWSFDVDCAEKKLTRGGNHLRTSIPHSLLNDGSYKIEFLSILHHGSWLVAPGEGRAVLFFSIRGGSVGSWTLSASQRPGIFFPAFPWDVNPIQDSRLKHGNTCASR
jgi:lipopolysaccharide transport system ATP-binding protein